jgi:hypothetical protein
MAIPTQPTKTTISTEALRRFYNGATPPATEVTRAEDYGLEKVKRDIMLIGKKWRPLETLAWDITKEGVSKYTLPSDYEAIKSVTLLDGDHTGLLTGVDNVTTLAYTLAADEDITEEQAVGSYLLITSGTGVKQAVQIDDYSTTTKVVTGAEAFATAPVVGDGYMVVNWQRDLDIQPMVRREGITYATKTGKPTTCFISADSTYGHIEMYECADDVYGLRIRYFADLLRLDITGTLYSTLLRRWAGVFEQGVYVWKLGEDDDRYKTEWGVYDSMLRKLAAADLEDYYNPNLQIQVSE